MLWISSIVFWSRRLGFARLRPVALVAFFFETFFLARGAFFAGGFFRLAFFRAVPPVVAFRRAGFFASGGQAYQEILALLDAERRERVAAI